MNYEVLVRQLDALSGNDPEEAHAEADQILLAACPTEIQAAYDRLVDRCAWWACA